jgi:hypothetical protein
MHTHTLITLLKLAGILHLGLVCAGATMVRTVGFREHIMKLPSFLRQLFLVYFVFVGLILFGFGMLTFFFADALAMGEPLARGLCVLMLVFWLVRLAAAAFVFDVRPYLTNGWYRLGYQATNLAFVLLVGVYALAAWKGGRL